MLYALCAALSLALLGLDQWVKHYVTVNIPLGDAQPFLPIRLPHAQQRGDMMPQGCQDLPVLSLIVLTKYMAALAVSYTDHPYPCLLQHKRRHLSGKLPFILPVHVLRPKGNVPGMGGSCRGVQGRIGRHHEQFQQASVNIPGKASQPV